MCAAAASFWNGIDLLIKQHNTTTHGEASIA
jgi:hypothetical protein